jgi:hypothetical protein
MAPSPIPAPRLRETPRIMDKRDIAEIVAAFGAAARRCREAGVDVLEVQTATDYLLGSFLSPRLNWRTDEYGGNIENRTRIVREILEVVRTAAGAAIAVGVRTSAAHMVPRDPQDYGPADSLAAMQVLDRAKLVDYVSLLNGSAWSMGETIQPMGYPRASLADTARTFKAGLGVPLTIAGRIRTAAAAEAILAAGQADLIGMARTWIADPEWTLKVREGREREIIPCFSCNQGCLGFVGRSQPGTCVINPRSGREHLGPTVKPATRPKRVAVVGGGPAGLEMARQAALAHHQVTLYEATPHLGGQFRDAAAAPERGELGMALEWWRNELERLQVRVVLNHPVAADAKLDADRVVWAVGSAPAMTQVWRSRPHLRQGIPGAGKLPHGRDVMAEGRRLSGRVLVIDEEGGWPAVSLVETLLAQSSVAHLTLATIEASLGGPDLDLYQEGAVVRGRVKGPRLTVLANTLIASVEGAFAQVEDGGLRLGPFDAMVLSTGTAARAVPEGARDRRLPGAARHLFRHLRRRADGGEVVGGLGAG